MIIEMKGDLFSSTTSLAHCVSADFDMGAGIAVEFKRRFGPINSGIANVGDCVTVPLQKDRFIYYLVTKKRYFEKPTYQSLRLSLEAMNQHIMQNNVREISMPRIGCGLDRLEWPTVRLMIDQIFTIPVYIYTLK